jgi:hypothetical protein
LFTACLGISALSSGFGVCFSLPLLLLLLLFSEAFSHCLPKFHGCIIPLLLP